MSIARPFGRHAAVQTSLHRRPRAQLLGIPFAGIASLLANLCLLNAALREGLDPHLAWAIAVEAGTLISFAAHQLITWRRYLPSSWPELARRLARFHLGALLALVLNLAVFTTLGQAHVGLVAAEAGGIAAGFGLNTVVGLFYTLAP